LVGRVLAGLVAERYRNIELLKDVICPVFIVHGQKDKLVPFKHSLELQDACKNCYCKLITPPEMDHNDLDFQTDLIKPLKVFF